MAYRTLACVHQFKSPAEPTLIGCGAIAQVWAQCLKQSQLAEGNLEVKLPTIWTGGKAQVGAVREEKRRRKKIKKEKVSEERKSRRAKRWESRKTLSFSNDLWPGGSKSRLAKAAGAEPCGQMKDEKFHAVVARSAF